MTVETFLILLTILSVVTSLLTESVKNFLDSIRVGYAANVLVLEVAVVVGGVGTMIWYMFNDIPWTISNIICIALMMLANWIGAMVGYDKVVQTISQIKSKG